MRTDNFSVQCCDFNEFYYRLAHTQDSALLSTQLPLALIGVLIFKIKLLEKSRETFTMFYVRLKNTLSAACDGKALTITDELQFISAFAEFAAKIPDTMLKNLRTWKNTAELYTAIQTVKTEVQEEQRNRCTMPY